MSGSSMIKVYLFTRFERFWHWIQVLMIAVLMITGLEVHGRYELLGFRRAQELHNLAGLSWLILFVFIIFWLLTTGQWRQYIPTTRKLMAVAWYYAFGIFRGESHPVQPSRKAKHNPLQRLAYLGLASFLLPLQMGTGLLYWTYNYWSDWGLATILNLGVVATIHLICAYSLLIFAVVHVYMTTTGHRVSAHLAAMITGWAEVDESYEVEDWERA